MTGKSKRGKSRAKLIILCVIAALVIAIASVGTYFLTDLYGVGGSAAEQTVTIEQGTGTAGIVAILEKQGIIRSGFSFRLYMKLTGESRMLYYGDFTLRQNMGYGEILDALSKMPVRDDLVMVTVPEGYRADQIAAVLEKAGVCSAEDFMNSVKNDTFDYDFLAEIPDNPDRAIRIEGYLYPETYSFAPDTPAKEVVNTMLRLFDERVPKELRDTAKKLGYTFDEMLSLASVIQLEASGDTAEMAKVSAVFHNRLKWTDQPRYLGSTPTTGTVYGDKYDTNKYEGLPPGPFCNPSLDCIKAALSPQSDFDYYYFVTDKYMKFYYTKTYSEHNAIIASLKADGLWL